MIFDFKMKLDRNFSNAVVNAQLEGPIYEVTELREIYDRRQFRLHEFVIANPYQKYVDMEDPEFENLVIKRFIQHHPEMTSYIEVDAEVAAEFYDL